MTTEKFATEGMARLIDVYLLPKLVERPEDLAGKAVVVIDILRATTTIVHALAAGAAEVTVCQEVDEALRLAASRSQGVVLGGERGGLPIAGFDLGNSPTAYTRERVAGREVIFTTTNGTRAMARCAAARRILIGAFTNFSAICRELADEPHVVLVCAGTDGEVTREDTLFAGAVVDELARGRTTLVNDQAEIAADAWRACVQGLTGEDPLGRALRSSRGGRNLIATGQEDDIDIAAQIDRFDSVPQLDPATWQIRVR
jgi:2-phosphosulfolactate phosphatase